MEKTSISTHVLIVDDEFNGRELLAELVQRILPKARIIKRESPPEAIEAVMEQAFDIIFSDIRMPQITGLEMLRVIKGMGHKPYIVLVSAYNEFDYAQEGIEIGVNGYILKPLTLEKVRKEIGRYHEALKNSLPLQTIMVKRGTDTFQVNVQDIKAIVRENKHFITIYTRHGFINYVSSYLKEIQGSLPEHFIYVNRQTIINMHYVNHFCNTTRTLFIEHPVNNLYIETSRNGARNFLDHCQFLIG
ncbi:MAG: response regulator [Tannerella sp.]|jgi:DNA-binding LytR/AlgR family response regulator|nr:response regulator [Tannerella sp.]